jgi:hypothetical protein
MGIGDVSHFAQFSRRSQRTRSDLIEPIPLGGKLGVVAEGFCNRAPEPTAAKASHPQRRNRDGRT